MNTNTLKIQLLLYTCCAVMYGAMPLSVMIIRAQSIMHETPPAHTRSYINDSRVRAIRTLLKRYNSPMTGSAHVFVEESDKQGIDWRLLVSIAGNESLFGHHIPPGSYNAWGWAVYTGKQSGAVFSNWDEAIRHITRELKMKYYNRGAITTEQIGRWYAADPAWSRKVNTFFYKLNDIHMSGLLASK